MVNADGFATSNRDSCGLIGDEIKAHLFVEALRGSVDLVGEVLCDFNSEFRRGQKALRIPELNVVEDEIELCAHPCFALYVLFDGFAVGDQVVRQWNGNTGR